MRRKQLIMVTRCALLILVLGLFGHMVLDAQSLAAVAKNTAEARAKTQAIKDAGKSEPTKVYTNKDLVDVPSTPSATIATSTPAVSAPVVSAVPTTPTNDETYWRGRMKAVRAICDAKAAIVKSYDDIQKQRVADARRDLLAACTGCSGTAEMRVTLPPIMQVEVEKAKVELAACNAGISTVEEEGRRAGIPAGWLRDVPGR